MQKASADVVGLRGGRHSQNQGNISPQGGHGVTWLSERWNWFFKILSPDCQWICVFSGSPPTGVRKNNRSDVLKSEALTWVPPTCPQSQDLPWVNPWTMNTWKYLRRTEWTIVMQHNAWLLGIPWSDKNITLKSHPDLVWKWPQCLVAAILEKLAELPGSSGNYGACG